MAMIGANNVILMGKLPEGRLHSLQGCRWSLLRQLMVNWGSSEPRPPLPPSWGHGAARCSSMCSLAGVSCTPYLWPSPPRSSGLFHGRHRRSRTCPWVWPVLSSGGCPHRGCSAADRPPWRSVKGDAAFIYHKEQKEFAEGHGGGIEVLISSAGAVCSHIQHRRSNGSGHRVSSEGVEVNGLVKRGCNFWKTRKSD